MRTELARVGEGKERVGEEQAEPRRENEAFCRPSSVSNSSSSWRCSPSAELQVQCTQVWWEPTWRTSTHEFLRRTACTSRIFCGRVMVVWRQKLMVVVEDVVVA